MAKTLVIRESVLSPPRQGSGNYSSINYSSVNFCYLLRLVYRNTNHDHWGELLKVLGNRFQKVTSRRAGLQYMFVTRGLWFVARSCVCKTCLRVSVPRAQMQILCLVRSTCGHSTRFNMTSLRFMTKRAATQS